MTRSSATLSLFAEPSAATGRPSSFAFSIVTHAAVAGIVYFAFTHAPRIIDPNLSGHFAVRQLDLHAMDKELPPDFPRRPATTQEKIPYPGQDVLQQLSASLSPALADAMQSFLGATAGHQTLIQPEFRTHLSFSEQVPEPSLMIWTPELKAFKKIIPPAPSAPTVANVKPSLELPNQEIRLADVSIASITMASLMDLPVGTTSPLETPPARLAQMAPATLSTSKDQPTPTAVLSISDVSMNDGAVFLPSVNDVAKLSDIGHGTWPAQAGSNPDLRWDSRPDREEVDDLTIDGRRLSTEHILLPKDGRFSVVVVGSSVSDQYPETPEIWANRMAYTAFLHVGLSKNWIMQYSLTRAAETANAGRVARLEAPWPYDIARPNLLARDLNADALIVHGVLGREGRFESLAVAFPSNFRYASFVLRTLRQWQFRPARQNGQSMAVEVLLVIPEEAE